MPFVLLKLNSSKKGTLVIKGSLRNRWVVAYCLGTWSVRECQAYGKVAGQQILDNSEFAELLVATAHYAFQPPSSCVCRFAAVRES